MTDAVFTASPVVLCLDHVNLGVACLPLTALCPVGEGHGVQGQLHGAGPGRCLPGRTLRSAGRSQAGSRECPLHSVHKAALAACGPGLCQPRAGWQSVRLHGCSKAAVGTATCMETSVASDGACLHLRLAGQMPGACPVLCCQQSPIQPCRSQAAGRMAHRRPALPPAPL